MAAAVILLIAAGILLLCIFRRKRRMLLFGEEFVVENPGVIFDHRLGLAGRPDFVLRDPKGRFYVACEYKTGRERLSHLLQAALYAWLVERRYRKPCYAVLRYSSGAVYGPFLVDDRIKSLAVRGMELARKVLTCGEPVRPEFSLLRFIGCGFCARCSVFLTRTREPGPEELWAEYRMWKREAVDVLGAIARRREAREKGGVR